MDNREILSRVDHTLLSITAKFDDIKSICDDAIEFKTASVCIPPSFVKKAKAYVKDRIPVCTIIGFPNGYSTTDVKVFETKDAISNGADEIDMVINLGFVKEGLYNDQFEEIKQVKAACGNKILKVIIETYALSENEKIKMCEIVSKSGADFIKTSTGFSGPGAKFEDIELFKQHLDPKVKIKASGGISSLEDAVKFINLGADRLGTSKIIKLIKDQR